MINSKSLLIAALLAATLPALTTLTACSPTPTRQAAGEYLDDATITTRVKSALVQDPDVRATEVNVETYRGVVQLSGFVDSESEARRAVNVARQVPGVNSVKNDIRIKPAR
ncbi:MAG TPA: BON domain-containing protein [Rhodocyclaceae bacterium]|nr:BON domain-containing protein [Rhodocyclaceae bacterium]